MLPSGVVDQDSPDGYRRRSEEVPAVIPSFGIRPADESQIRLVHQGGGLQGLSGRLVGQMSGSEFSQFRIHDRQQLGSSACIPSVDGIQNVRDVCGHFTSRGGASSASDIDSRCAKPLVYEDSVTL